MAKLGWGTPTLVSLELGLILEIPRPALRHPRRAARRAAGGGRRDAHLQVNFLGVVDFEQEQFPFDASLFDSRLLDFTLTGDMAVRFYWGDEREFPAHRRRLPSRLHAAADGPRHAAPARASCIFEGNPDLRAEAYFAVTSNTVQFGAQVELYYGVERLQCLRLPRASTC